MTRLASKYPKLFKVNKELEDLLNLAVVQNHDAISPKFDHWRQNIDLAIIVDHFFRENLHDFTFNQSFNVQIERNSIDDAVGIDAVIAKSAAVQSRFL